jgi:hypothetical protein
VQAQSLSPDAPQMATMICFSGVGGDGITVEESPEQILDVLKDRHGTAVLLTLNGVRDGVYINADRIACWYTSRKGEPPFVPRPFIGTI